MKPETAAWVEKAEADLATTRRELRARKCPNYDAACFHAQQCGEKYIKARLVESGIAFPKVHSLTALLHLILPSESSWSSLKPDAAQLTVYAVEFRYPGKSADKALARDAVMRACRIREIVRQSLALSIDALTGSDRKKRKRKSASVPKKRTRR